MQLSKAIEGFTLSKRADGRKDKTIEMYDWSLGMLCRHFAGADVDHISTDALRAFYAGLPTSETQLSPRSIQMVHIHVGALFKWLFSEGYIHFRPDDKIQIPRAPEPNIQPFTQDEVRRMLKSAHFVHIHPEGRKAYSYRQPLADRNRAILLTLLSTGCRAGELCGLNMADVNLDSGAVQVRAQKTPFPRTVYLDNATRKAVWRYLTKRGESRLDEPLFLSDDGARMTPHGVYMLCTLIGKRAKVPNAHPHRWRHTFGVTSILHGMDIRRLQILMGHRSITMTQRYLKISQPDVQAIHAATSAADRWRL